MPCITSSANFPDSMTTMSSCGSDVRKASRRCAYGSRLSAPDVLTRKTSQILPSVPHAIPLLSEPGPQIHGNYLVSGCLMCPESLAGELPWHEADHSRRTNSVHITQSIIRALFATSNITAGASAQPSTDQFARVFSWTRDRTQNPNSLRLARCRPPSRKLCGIRWL